MLALRRKPLNIHLLFVLAVCLPKIKASAERNEFVTTKHHHRRLAAGHEQATFDDVFDHLTASVPEQFARGRDDVYDRVHMEYKLRYRPQRPMPRLFWQKFPQQQQEAEPGMDDEGGVSPSAMEPVDDDASVDEETEQPPIDGGDDVEEVTTATPNITPTESSTKATTVDMPTPTPLPTLTPTPSTTFSTIMMPPIVYTPQLGHKLKHWLFGSPTKLNLLQKTPQRPPLSIGDSSANRTLIRTKSKGFLSLFEVIKFENSKCSITVGDIRTTDGVCYHELECKSLGGIATERCAEGVGVCCVFVTGCGDTTNQPIVYYESPNYPNAVRDAMICVLTINLRPNVQQLRLDLLMFELSRPTNGDCIDDQFVISGYNANFAVPVLCGINTGHHIYVHAGDSFERKIYLSFFTRAAGGGRSFNIKITQLDSTDLAPDGCLQYYTASEGVLKSFNYDLIGTIVDNSMASYLNNLNYVICMARAKDTCSVVYSVEQVNDELPDFQIVNVDVDENDIVGKGQAGAGIFNCPDDFVGVNTVRLCGERFNDGSVIDDYTAHAAVRDITPGPIVLPFRSDDQHVGRGFRFSYRQEACGTIAAST